MSDDPQEIDLELEALLSELAPTPFERQHLLEEHRQLEKDLLRLADPLPPPDFLKQVMAKIEAAPAPAMSRSEIAWGLAVIGVSALLAATAFGLSSSAGGVGVAAAQSVVFVREAVVGMGSALAALWQTAAVPMMAALGMMLVVSLVALKRLAASPAPVKVVS